MSKTLTPFTQHGANSVQASPYTIIITNIIMWPTISKFSFPSSHVYTPVTELRHVGISDNVHYKTDIILSIVYSGLQGA
jgi:urate oxidase